MYVVISVGHFFVVKMFRLIRQSDMNKKRNVGNTSNIRHDMMFFLSHAFCFLSFAVFHSPLRVGIALHP